MILRFVVNLIQRKIEMMYLVTAYFDESTSNALQKLIYESSEKSGNEFMTANKIPPHMTLFQFQSKEDKTKLVRIFKRIDLLQNNPEIRFIKVESEIPHVIYVSVEKNKKLLEINKMLFDSFSQVKETIINRHYVPEEFYPHVSLAKRLDDLQRNKIINLLDCITIPSSGKITGIVLTEGNPPRKLCEVILN